VLLATAALLLALAAVAVWLAVRTVGVSPRLLGPYLERRASGHHPLIEAVGRQVNRSLQWIDRGTLAARGDYPPWALPPRTVPDQAPAAARAVTVIEAAQLQPALDAALPGDVITIAPGRYRLRGSSLHVHRPGRADAPIVLRAPQPGSVLLEFEMLEGFVVAAPHWVFEQLEIVGVCRNDDDCEHAFHVVGAGQHVTIRDNRLREFNAHLKINGHGGRFPDHGIVRGNQLVNTRARRTDAPVTPIDLVAASGWRIEHNLIADFVKDGGNFTSYGAFAKGGGSDNRFERNVVLCEYRLRGAAGRRIGLSFGGGGTGASVCRDGRCVVEHERGRMVANLIASCSDDGIYVNRAAQTELRHNTLIDTAGINVRFADSSAQVEGNLLDAPIAARDGAIVRARDNASTTLLASYLGLSDVRARFADALALELSWSGRPPRRASAPAEAGGTDLCGASRAAPPTYGAFEDIGRCSARER
jgi:nitrous oxidase accessory protein NosD